MHFDPPPPFDTLNQSDYEAWYDMINSIVNFVTASTQLASSLRNGHSCFPETVEILEAKNHCEIFNLADFPWFLTELKGKEIKINKTIPVEYQISEAAPLIQFPMCDIMQGEPNTEPRTFTLMDTKDFGDVGSNGFRCPASSSTALAIKKVDLPKPEESNQSFFQEFTDSEQTIDSSNLQEIFEYLEQYDGKDKVNVLNENSISNEKPEKVLAVYDFNKTEPPLIKDEGELYLECDVEEFVVVEKNCLKISNKEEGVHVDNNLDFAATFNSHLIEKNVMGVKNASNKLLKPKLEKSHHNTTEIPNSNNKKEATKAHDKINVITEKLSNKKNIKINSNKKQTQTKAALNKNELRSHKNLLKSKSIDKPSSRQPVKKKSDKNYNIVNNESSKEHVDYIRQNITNCLKPKTKAKIDAGKEKFKSSRQNNQPKLKSDQSSFSADAVKVLHPKSNKLPKARSLSPPPQKQAPIDQPEIKSCLKLETKKRPCSVKKCVINDRATKYPAMSSQNSVLTKPPLIRDTTLRLTATETLRKATELLKSAEKTTRGTTALKMQVVSGLISPNSTKSSKR